MEKAVPGYLREGRPTSVLGVLLGPGIEIWKSCMFFGGMLRALRDLPGGLARFLSCEMGAKHCQLRRVGTMWTRVHVSFSGVFIGWNAG